MTSQKKHKNYVKPSNLKLLYIYIYIILLLHFLINSNLKFMSLNFTIGNQIFQSFCWNIFNLNFQSNSLPSRKNSSRTNKVLTRGSVG